MNDVLLKHVFSDKKKKKNHLIVKFKYQRNFQVHKIKKKCFKIKIKIC
jgi:hypothetical protein